MVALLSHATETAAKSDAAFMPCLLWVHTGELLTASLPYTGNLAKKLVEMIVLNELTRKYAPLYALADKIDHAQSLCQKKVAPCPVAEFAFVLDALPFLQQKNGEAIDRQVAMKERLDGASMV